MTRKRKNKKTYFFFRPKTLLGVVVIATSTLLVCVPLAITDLASQAPNTTLPPSVHILDEPQGSYNVSEVIHYRIQVQWPEAQTNLRMSPPELDLQNLTLLRVGQETVAHPEGELASVASEERILDFQFRPLEPGPASINNISLAWTSRDGAVSSRVHVPGLDVTIRNNFSPLVIIGVGGGIALIVGLGLLARGKKQVTTPVTRQLSFSEALLSDLEAVHRNWSHQKNAEIFIAAIMTTADHYLAQELDWHLSRDSYNALEEKASKRWTSKDAALLSDLIKNLEFHKFSGTAPSSNQLESLYQVLHSFIQKKRVVSTE